MRVRDNMQRALALLIMGLFATGASSQQFVYPAKGQSPEQQKKDEAQCRTWAVQQSKYDPAKPPPSTAGAKPPTTATGTTPGGAVLGAAPGRKLDRIAGCTRIAVSAGNA